MHDANNGAEFSISTPIHQLMVNQPDTGHGVEPRVHPPPLQLYAQDALQTSGGAEPCGSVSGALGVLKGSPGSSKDRKTQVQIIKGCTFACRVAVEPDSGNDSKH